MKENSGMSIQEVTKLLLHKIWLIILWLIIGGSTAYAISAYLLTPTYSSNVSMYVNNTNAAESTLSINDLNVAQQLVTTYIEILKSDTVLDKVIDKLNLSYSTSELRKMISATGVSDTEIFNIEVTATNPEEAADIANTLATVLPEESIKVVQAGGVKLIDEAKPDYDAVSPNIGINTLIGILVGVILCIMFIILRRLLDTKVRSEEDFEEKYDIPVLGIVPNMVSVRNNSYK